MSAKAFLDTNIFVYSFDERHQTKRRKAQALIERALADQTGVVSFQVIQEFFNVALRKFSMPFSVHDCKAYLDRVLSPLCDIFPSMRLYRLALDTQEETGWSFYDALIVASAIEGGCETIYSEDLQRGRSLAGVTIQNPF
jgi:predicted nucleic acid-binding protein